MLRTRAKFRRRTAEQSPHGIDRSLIDWMLSLTPRQRLEALERQRRMLRAVRRDQVDA